MNTHTLHALALMRQVKRARRLSTRPGKWNDVVSRATALYLTLLSRDLDRLYKSIQAL